MLDRIDGLPAHVLLVHAVVVLVPLAALFAVLGSVWPAARRKLGVITPITAFAALVLVPVTTHAGEWLERHVPSTALVRRHTQLGDSLLIWAALLFVLATVVWGMEFVVGRGWSVPSLAIAPATRGVASVLLCVVAVVAVVQVYRIGESGARAAWDDRVSTTNIRN